MKLENGTTIRTAACLAGLAHLLAGCNSGNLPTYPVSGQVLYADGKLLPNGGIVKFVCSDMTPPIEARGVFGADGKFVLTTYNTEDGAVAGKHKAIVIPNVPDDREEGMSLAEYSDALHPIDKKFQHPDASGLEFTVSAEAAPHDFRIEVTKSRKRRR